MSEWEREEQQLRLQAKAALRQRIRGLRRVMPREACEKRSSAICRALLDDRDFVSARCIVGYASIRNEVDPAFALSRAHQLGKVVGLPRIQADRLVICRVERDTVLEPNAHGIDEPPADSPVIADADIDLILVPVVAVDGRGHRVGYGKGYYDRLLPRLTAARTVALAYDFQLVAEAPNTEQDVAVDRVITDRRSIETP